MILYGLGRFGGHLAHRLSEAGHRVLAVDFDPHQIKTHSGDEFAVVFGSAEDEQLLEALPLAQAKYVISAIPIVSVNLTLLHALRHHGFDGTIALTAHTHHDAERLRTAGVHIVLEPFSTAARATSDTLHELLTDGGGATGDVGESGGHGDR